MVTNHPDYKGGITDEKSIETFSCYIVHLFSKSFM